MPKHTIKRTIRRLGLLTFALFYLSPVIAIAGLPMVSEMTVTDVTTRSFSVIWIASEPSTPDVVVYDDADGLVETLGVQTSAHPLNNENAAIRTSAEDMGVMKVRVTGLLPDTTYYFRTQTTSKSTSETTLSPVSSPLPDATTQMRTTRTEWSGETAIPFTNDLIVYASTLLDSTPPAGGILLVASVDGAGAPVSGFVGDGVPSPLAVVDLNNLFTADTHETMPLAGGETLTLTQVMGSAGTATTTHTIPMNNQLGEIKYPEALSCPGDTDGDLDVDGVDLITLARSLYTTSGDTAYNPDADFNLDGAVDETDLTDLVARFGQPTCP